MEILKEKSKAVYCAIYTRKSTSDGLDQEFSSLDAQRESSESYINSQKHEGWVPLPDRYDDGGFTGANVERPALQKLLNDIKEGRINCVVVYKVDRLSRSLLDFTQMLEFFDKNNVTFVSITQHFNTTTSMGRLTLNILLSFAQFEREIISERTKDKLSAIRKKGQWLGGRPAIGYEVEKGTKRLIVNPNEAAIIKEIFNLYLQNGNSLSTVVTILNERGYLSRTWTIKNGSIRGGKKLKLGTLQSIINNVLYIGKVKYEGQIYDGQQPPIIDEETFKRTQEKLFDNRIYRKNYNKDCFGLLSHLLKCKTCGTPMVHTYTARPGRKRYRYYICTNSQNRRYKLCPNSSINAQETEAETLKIIRKVISENKEKFDINHENEVDKLLSSSWSSLSPEEMRSIMKCFITEILCDVETKILRITLKNSETSLEFNVEINKSKHMKRWHKEIEVVQEPKVRRSLILAHQIQRLMDEGKIENPKQASEWTHFSHSRIDHILGLLLLSPIIQGEILLEDNNAISLIPEYKVRSVASEPNWKLQEQHWKEIKSYLSKN